MWACTELARHLLSRRPTSATPLNARSNGVKHRCHYQPKRLGLPSIPLPSHQRERLLCCRLAFLAACSACSLALRCSNAGMTTAFSVTGPDLIAKTSN